MLCTPVFIFTSGSSAFLGHPHCGLLIWLSLRAIFNTLFWVYVSFFTGKGQNTKILKSAIFIWYENGCWRLLVAQSINEKASTLCTILRTPGLHWTHIHQHHKFTWQNAHHNRLHRVEMFTNLTHISRSPCSMSTNTTSRVYLAQCSFPPILGNLPLTFTLLALCQGNNSFEQGSWVPQLQGSHQMHAFILSFLCWNHVNRTKKDECKSGVLYTVHDRVSVHMNWTALKLQ